MQLYRRLATFSINIMNWLLFLLALLHHIKACPSGYSIHGNHCCIYIMCPPGTEPVRCDKNEPNSTYCKPCGTLFYQNKYVASDSSVRCIVKRLCLRKEGKVTFLDGDNTRNRVCRCNEAAGYYDPFEEAPPDDPEYSVNICQLRLNEPGQKASDQVTVRISGTVESNHITKEMTREESNVIGIVLGVVMVVIVIVIVLGFCCYRYKCRKHCPRIGCHGQGKDGQPEELQAVSSGNDTIHEEMQCFIGEKDVEMENQAVLYTDHNTRQGSLEMEESLGELGLPPSHSSSSSGCDNASISEGLQQTDVKGTTSGSELQSDPTPNSGNFSSPPPYSRSPSNDPGPDDQCGSSPPESAAAEHQDVNRCANNGHIIVCNFRDIVINGDLNIKN